MRHFVELLRKGPTHPWFRRTVDSGSEYPLPPAHCPGVGSDPLHGGREPSGPRRTPSILAMDALHTLIRAQLPSPVTYAVSKAAIEAFTSANYGAECG